MLSKQAILRRIRREVRLAFENSLSWVHDFDHTARVVANGQRLAQGEKINPFLVELACLLHDLGRIKEKKIGLNWGVSKHAEDSYQLAQPILKLHKKEIGEKNVKKILEAVLEHSRPGLVNPKNKISQVLQDADRGVGLSWYGIVSVLNFNRVIKTAKPSSERKAEKILKNHWNKIFRSPKKRREVIYWLKYLAGWYKGRKETAKNPYVAPLHTKTAKKLYKKGFENLKRLIKELKSQEGYSKKLFK